MARLFTTAKLNVKKVIKAQLQCRLVDSLEHEHTFERIYTNLRICDSTSTNPRSLSHWDWRHLSFKKFQTHDVFDIASGKLECTGMIVWTCCEWDEKRKNKKGEKKLQCPKWETIFQYQEVMSRTFGEWIMILKLSSAVRNFVVTCHMIWTKRRLLALNFWFSSEIVSATWICV